VRIQNVLPQTFRLSLITLGRTTSVQQIELPDSNAVEIPLSIGGGVDEMVLVVSGVTRFTHQKADYSYSLQSR
jgi:microcompartment protein CcmK/EutM